MWLHFLGTGSSFPTTRRGVSALALRHDDGPVWLFDCGEGTQIQFQKTSVTSQKITAIFISHLHGDHLFGLPGLLCTISSQLGEEGEAGKKVVDIYGPKGINKFVNTALHISCSPLIYSFRVHELVPIASQYPEDWEWGSEGDETVPAISHLKQLPGSTITPVADSQGNLHWPLMNNDRWCVQAGWIHHRVPTFGFVLIEKDRPGTLDSTKLTSLGVKLGPMCGELKAGRSVVTDSGRTVRPEEVLGPSIPGRTLVILGDTSDASPLAHLVSECDVLVHEATHGDALAEKAVLYGHSTPLRAVAFAQQIQAKTLLLNHFSQRYHPADSQGHSKEESVELLADEGRQAASGSGLNVMCADDMFVFDIPPRSRAQSSK
ncbi:hypothetical protein Pcinc_037433 [Petrolisthes cinctipes]|uniref:Zinc phosphodiesterase ELAC protein 1 n=1 Tax=Petrolisthes cinctipes TaxID=88211 RepID=A0AAE1ELJ0_PETCI|nr:hypothetical protein Pcinc_037433 [Petrolisthes cinctipes]